MYFGHKHIETGPYCSQEFAIFFKYHMPLKKIIFLKGFLQFKEMFYFIVNK